MLVFALWIGCAGSACDPNAEVDEAPRSASQPPATHIRPLTQSARRASDSAPRSAPRRGRFIGGERVQRVAQWPQTTELAQEVRARAPAAVLAAVDRSPVPVLVPGDPSWLARAHMFVPEGPQAFGYAFAGTLAERHLSIHASRIATLVPHIGQVRGDPVRSGVGSFSVNEGVRTASWIEHGIAYSVDLECFDPEAPTCDDRTLRELVAGLVYVGGVGGAP